MAAVGGCFPPFPIALCASVAVPELLMVMVVVLMTMPLTENVHIITRALLSRIARTEYNVVLYMVL